MGINRWWCHGARLSGSVICLMEPLLSSSCLLAGNLAPGNCDAGPSYSHGGAIGRACLCPLWGCPRWVTGSIVDVSIKQLSLCRFDVRLWKESKQCCYITILIVLIVLVDGQETENGWSADTMTWTLRTIDALWHHSIVWHLFGDKQTSQSH